MLDTSNYYPFGLNHTGGNGLNSSGFGSWQSYKYNGKELQETGMYDFGARMHMADLGRWGVIDPLAEQMRRYAPYNFAFNNPVNFIDPDGMKPMNQLKMAGESTPDASSGWTNPNWLGLGNDDSYGSSYGFGSLENTVVTATKVVSSMLAGAAIGTAIPIPIVGTILGAVGGAVVGYLIGEVVARDFGEAHDNFEK
ncbi:RHS repeat-associated core domain-containing protein [Chryseobacterium sp. 52]|uniref:RHS repeat-associated core domain-containing protein n=1 Tax=Chryseobacterium sp. 52 TaxID=2035213 RepID=UPI002936DBB9|nr:RHS repeat-associated core domain-containing protein [Chryseobacterium sp. 52]